MNVAVRLRPAEHAKTALVTHSGSTVVVSRTAEYASAMQFSVPSVFDAAQPTDDVFDACLAPIIDRVRRDGVPGCLFVYGQTGSGKTHTVSGDVNRPGLIPLAVGKLLADVAADTSLQAACVYFSYVEVYNEVVRDLMAPAGSPPLGLLEGKDGDVRMPSMRRIPVHSVADAHRLIAAGEDVRAKADNVKHERASRSHALFTLTVEAVRKDDSRVSVGTVQLVDLAGSETNTSAIDGAPDGGDYREAVSRRVALGDIGNAHLNESRAKESNARNAEGSHIRRSLLALVRCVQRLADKAPFVPYRDSKLTRLLRRSLERNSNTGIVCTVDPAEGKESIATLRFAATAQRVAPTAVRAQRCAGAATGPNVALALYEREVSSLRQALAASTGSDRSDDLEAALRERDLLAIRIADAERRLAAQAAERDHAMRRALMAELLEPATSTAAFTRAASAPPTTGDLAEIVAVPTDGPRIGRLEAENAALRSHIEALEGRVSALSGALEAADRELDVADDFIRGQCAAAKAKRDAAFCTSSSAALPQPPTLRRFASTVAPATSA